MDIVKIFDGETVHIVSQDDEVFFRAGHVAKVLGISNVHDSMISIFSKEVGDVTDYRVSMKHDDAGQSITYLTEKGLYALLWRSRKDIAAKFRDWVYEVLKDIRRNGNHALKQHVAELEGERNALQYKLRPTATYLYAFKTDRHADDDDCEVKFGMSDDVDARQANFLTVAPHAMQIVAERVPKQHARTAEKKIMLQLLRMTGKVVNSEVYRSSVEEAKATVRIVSDLVNLYADQTKDGVTRRLQVLGCLVAVLNERLHDGSTTGSPQLVASELTEIRKHLQNLSEKQDLSRHESDTISESQPVSPDDETNEVELPAYDFDRFICECCDIGDDLRDDSVTIVGRHRLWAGFTNQEVKFKIHAYLKKKFVPVKFTESGRNHHGFQGVRVKRQEMAMSSIPTQSERFLQETCTYCPASRLYDCDITSKFTEWRQAQDKDYTSSDAELREVHKYLNSHFLRATLWIPERGHAADGYYGICVQGDEERFFTKMPPTTACIIVGVDPTTGIIQREWSSVSDAAAALGISTSSVSRSAKNRKLRDGLLIEYKDRK